MLGPIEMEPGTIQQQADRNQRRAADPQASAWVSASAGTGKTSVLINRILRLLLTGVKPQRVLCLTFTKVAAAEMQNRLHERLMGWASMPEQELAEKLQKLTGETPAQDTIRRARQLFALTLETEGGLKIHTIHGFCERLLHRFPLEAGIAADFTVLDETSAAELRSRSIDRVLAAAADAESPLNQALGEVVALSAEQSFRELLAAAPRQDRTSGRHSGDGSKEHAPAWLAGLLGLAASRDRAEVKREIAALLDDVTLDKAIALLATGGTSDRGRAEHLSRARQASAPEARADAFRAAFLTKGGDPLTRVITNEPAGREPEIAGALEVARDRCYALVLEERAIRLLAANSALAQLSAAMQREYRVAKAACAALDYDDLIVKAADLLRVSEAAAWVLYKLDGGIDHILVDEAQDTSPLQWRVIDSLAHEFFSGEGAREVERTVFAVGDEKQSIYRFQGAEPKQFAAQGRTFAKRVRDAGKLWHDVPLNLSFRSTATVLEAVDGVFAGPQAAAGLTWEGELSPHFANRTDQTGSIEIWQPEAPSPRDEVPPFEPWRAARAPREAPDRLAQRIADKIKYWLDNRILLPSKGRPIRPEDILILVRKRKPFAAPMIRALKERGIPVAGADRMRLSEQIAVMDLMALGDFVLLPQDDLTLATVLKSPLIGLDDDDLFELAHGRRGSLWEVLRDGTGQAEKFARAHERLQRWLARADFLAPYEFFAALLEEDGGAIRRDMIARLGPDAADAIDEFLNLALGYDADELPSLQSFLHWVRRADVEIKRDMEQGRDEVRIMTVHGAKGLEANIVFLPDTCATRRPRANLLPIEAGNSDEKSIWAPSDLARLDPIQQAKARIDELEQHEYHRLLYVAMTRARDQLYVCGWEGQNGRDEGCWYDLIWEGLKSRALEARDENGEKVWRIAGEEASETAAAAGAVSGEAVAEPLPDWAKSNAPQEARAVLAVTPSSVVLGPPGAADHTFPEQSASSPAMLADQSRFARGRLIHTLLEHLPGLVPGEWEARATAFMEARGTNLEPEARNEIVAEVIQLLEDPEFAPLFGPGSQAEVPIIARFPGEQDGPGLEISGQVDRLVIGAQEILIADYKTNRPPPERVDEVAPAYLAQLAAYRMALARAYSGKPVRCALVWTASPALLAIPDNLLDAYEEAIKTSAER